MNIRAALLQNVMSKMKTKLIVLAVLFALSLGSAARRQETFVPPVFNI